MSKLLTESFPEIKHLSASNLNKWQGDWSDEGLWCLSYLYGNKFEGSPATIRGQVIETCFHRILLNKGTENLNDFAKRTFVEQCEEMEGVTDDDIQKEFDTIDGYLEQCERSIRECQLKLPNQSENATQLKVDFPLSKRIPWNAVGYIDFDFGDYALDLKTTNKLPRKGVKPDHKRQISLYAKARDERVAKILYLSPKDYVFYSLFDREIDAGFDELVFRGESLCDRLEAAAILAKHYNTDPKTAMTKLVTPDTSGWAWGDEEMMFAAENNLWNIKINKNI